MRLGLAVVGCDVVGSNVVGLSDGWLVGADDGGGVGLDEGTKEGFTVGFADGSNVVGVSLGMPVGWFVGDLEGSVDRPIDGDELGTFEGDALGAGDGNAEGKELGLLVGRTDGETDGSRDGCDVGFAEGKSVGIIEGFDEGSADCFIDGLSVGASEDGDSVVGAADVGVSVGSGKLKSTKSLSFDIFSKGPLFPCNPRDNKSCSSIALENSTDEYSSSPTPFESDLLTLFVPLIDGFSARTAAGSNQSSIKTLIMNSQ